MKENTQAIQDRLDALKNRPTDTLQLAFDNAIDNELEKLIKTIKKDAAAEYLDQYRQMDLTEAQIIKLAKDYLKLQLAQELQFRLTRDLLG